MIPIDPSGKTALVTGAGQGLAAGGAAAPPAEAGAHGVVIQANGG